jgi:hypothetical protein
MLKLHHMNLLNEIQETTLMMNLYQQQQLQQQQQQLQQRQASVESMMPDLSGSKRGSLSLGSVGESALAPAPKKIKARSSNAAAVTKIPKETGNSWMDTAPVKPEPRNKSDLEQELLKSQKEHEALEAKLKKIKEDIARREKEAEELQRKADAAGVGSSRSKDDDKKDDSEVEEDGDTESADQEPRSLEVM